MGADAAKLSNKHAILVCDRLLRQVPTSVTRLDGTSRTVWRAQLPNDRTVIVAYRENTNRSQLEKVVLSRLTAAGAPVPQLLASKGSWIIQSDLGVARLPNLFNQGSAEAARNLIVSATEGLVRIQMAADQTDLNQIVALIGRREGWIENLTLAPRRLGAVAGIQAPRLDGNQLAQIVGNPRSHFIKWDARPANAVVGLDGDVSWFDFEHCGCRDPLDDFAWLLADEYLPEDPEFEQLLINQFIDLFAAGLPEKQARRYLSVFGTLHMCVRLSVVLNKKGNGAWLSPRQCLELDTVGATRNQFAQLILRATRWASQDKLTAPLALWLVDLGEKFLGAEFIQESPLLTGNMVIGHGADEARLPEQMMG